MFVSGYLVVKCSNTYTSGMSNLPEKSTLPLAHNIDTSGLDAQTLKFLENLKENGFYAHLDKTPIDLSTELVGAPRPGRKLSLISPRAPGLVITGAGKREFSPSYVSNLDKAGNLKVSLQEQLNSIQQVIAVEGKGQLRIIDEDSKDLIVPATVLDPAVVKEIKRNYENSLDR